MAQKARSVAVHQIFLDNENPRHDPIDNEPAIIARLVAAERIVKLATDIAKWGLSPLDRMAIVAHPTQKSRFVVVEGNRRLCVAKLLADPERAPTEANRRIFRELKKNSVHTFANVEAVLFNNREEARHWLTLRHEGALEGAGTRAWDADQKTRFNRTQGEGNNPNALALLVLEYATQRSLISEEQRSKVNLTTVTRFLGNPLVRDALGLASNKSLTITVPQDQFDRALKQFLNDSLTEKSPVHSRTSAEDRERYARALRTQGVSPTTTTDQPTELNAKTGDALGAGTAPKRATRDNRSPDHRNSVIPSDFTCHITDKIHKRIYDELKRIDHGEFSFSAAYLLRAMIELTTRAYCKKHKIGTNAELHVLVSRAAEHLQAAGIEAKKLKALRVMANNRDVGYSPESLGASIHGGAVPTKVELARYWDTMEGGIHFLLDGAA